MCLYYTSTVIEVTLSNKFMLERVQSEFTILHSCDSWLPTASNYTLTLTSKLNTYSSYSVVVSIFPGAMKLLYNLCMRTCIYMPSIHTMHGSHKSNSLQADSLLVCVLILQIALFWFTFSSSCCFCWCLLAVYISDHTSDHVITCCYGKQPTPKTYVYIIQ